MGDVDGFSFRIVEPGAIVKHQEEMFNWTHGTGPLVGLRAIRA